MAYRYFIGTPEMIRTSDARFRNRVLCFNCISLNFMKAHISIFLYYTNLQILIMCYNFKYIMVTKRQQLK